MAALFYIQLSKHVDQSIHLLSCELMEVDKRRIIRIKGCIDGHQRSNRATNRYQTCGTSNATGRVITTIIRKSSCSILQSARRAIFMPWNIRLETHIAKRACICKHRFCCGSISRQTLLGNTPASNIGRTHKFQVQIIWHAFRRDSKRPYCKLGGPSAIVCNDNALPWEIACNT